MKWVLYQLLNLNIQHKYKNFISFWEQNLARRYSRYTMVDKSKYDTYIHFNNELIL